ncbi:MAG TPA: hypothetical protein ENK23_04150, partial [Sorangium sp.]|nr:hypothetical protein [Sorangium sp.]
MANSDEIRRKREAAKQRRMAGQALAALLASDVNAFGKLRQQRDLLAPFDDHELAQLKRLLQIAADALLGDPGGASWEAVNTALQQLPSPSTAERDTPSGAGPTPSAPSPAPSPVGPSPATPPSQP